MLDEDDVAHRLEDDCDGAAESLRELLDRYPSTDYVLIEYLFGLDHAVVAYARTAEHDDLQPSITLFAGVGADLAVLEAHDVEHGTLLAAELRSSETVRDLQTLLPAARPG